ncbi:AraC family transcriptional regulator [Pseudodesulfovibrio sediminis]|uniref:AraC family transcriptional regulator n=1 Tax=Pseudodesulfovibrio sediminis TaxID=2810563 RepID=A0ABM7P660_9BACT|nr:AraC family transcriptional regulator [Pseudodesulfovibrio sediminis]BCS88400.1 AraC family transcriptional regulator [Pseudodesulfovibrio sediminis]
MTTAQQNTFQFAKAESDVDITVLNAVMADFSYANHAHEDFALGVTREGIQEFSCNGSQFRSAPGNIILFNPGDVHNGHPGNEDALKYTMLYLDPNHLLSLVGCASETGRKPFRIGENHFEDRMLRPLIMDMAQLVAGTAHTLLEYDHLLYEIAKRLAQRMGVFAPDAWKDTKDTLLLKVRDHIHDHISEDISIDDLSQVASISKYHFIRLFRSQFGLTPHRYILIHRINRAREALDSGIAPSTLAQELGFFDASHMNRHFKRAYGVTPKQYQRQLTK